MTGLGQVTRCFDGGNEPSASIQYVKYVDKLRNYSVLNRDSDTWN